MGEPSPARLRAKEIAAHRQAAFGKGIADREEPLGGHGIERHPVEDGRRADVQELCDSGRAAKGRHDITYRFERFGMFGHDIDHNSQYVRAQVLTNREWLTMPRYVTKLFMPREFRPDLEREIGLRLEAARLALGYETQEAFATHAGLGGPRYHQYEKGTRFLPARAAMTLCRVYDLTMDYLYHGDMRMLPHDLVQKIMDQRAKAEAKVPESGAEPRRDSDTTEREPQKVD